uniref:Death domain-containing protein n=1 Tax=Amphimedon queenslandica TaxID=400682 RepID=A0A1X7TW02_AMPQE
MHEEYNDTILYMINIFIIIYIYNLQGSVLYSGVLYHQQKEVGCWETTLAVGKDANALIQHIRSTFPHAEQDTSISFTFAQPNGILELKLSPVGRVPREYGWRLDPKQEPMQIHVFQSVVENALMGSCSMSVYAKPGVATESIRHPIKLLGIEPETTIYINRQPPPSPFPAAPLKEKRSNEIVLRMHMHELGDPLNYDYGCDLINKQDKRIKKNLVLTPNFLQSLVERGVINEKTRNFLNESYDKTGNEIMDLLITDVWTAVYFDETNFLFFLEAMRDQDSAETNKLADILKMLYVMKREKGEDDFRLLNLTDIIIV